MNSKKIISSVSLATAVLATGIISQEAHADSVDNTTTTTASQAQPQLVTAEQVASAKATFENNQEAQAQAQSVADSKKQALDTAKANTTTAQDAVAKAETAAASATDTNIQVAKEAIPTAETKVQSAKEAVETAKTDVTTKEASQSQAQEAVNKAQGNVNQAQEAVDEATQIQSEKQTAVDKSAKEVEAAKQGVTNAQATLAEKTSKVSQAKQTVETAKQNDAKLDADTKAADINVEKADQAVQVAKSDVDIAKAKADEAAQVLKDANHPTHIIMTDEFKQNLKDYLFNTNYSNRQEEQAALQKAIQSENASRKLNQAYLDTFEPDTTGVKYDVTNLPLELQTELSQYFAYLLNDARQQLGQPKIVVNTDAIKFATLVAGKYEKNHDPFSGHDKNAVNDAAKEMGYWYDHSYRTNPYESMAGGIIDSSYKTDDFGRSLYKIGDKVEATKSELYKLMADNVSGFIYEGEQNGHYGHADSLMKDPSLGLAITLTHTDEGFGEIPMTETHVLCTDDKSLLDSSKNVPDLVIPDKQAAEVADRAAQAALVTATAQAQAAQTHSEQAKAAYDALVATPRQTADAEAKLATAKAELVNAQTALETAENTLATVTASHADKVAALDMAKTARDEAVNALTAEQNKLATANAELAQRETATTVAKAKLREVEQAVKDAEQAVIDAKATYEQLVKAKANLETARQAYAKVVAAQDAAQVAYDKAIVALTNAKAQTALSGTKYTNLKAAYDARIAYEAAQRKAKEEALRRQAERDAKAKQVRQDVNGTQSNRVNSSTYVGVHTTSFSAAQVATAEATQAVVNRRGTTDYQAPLPQTGEADTAAYLLAGLGVLGLAGVTARKRRG